jgi:stage III sporulation protein AD
MAILSIKACALAMLCVVAGAIVKQARPEFLPYVRIAVMTVLFGMAISAIAPLTKYMKSLFDGAVSDDYISSILKALGIAALTQISADVCRDCGEGSAASGVELIGRLELIILCLPLIENIIASVGEVISW